MPVKKMFQKDYDEYIRKKLEEIKMEGAEIRKKELEPTPEVIMSYPAFIDDFQRFFKTKLVAFNERIHDLSKIKLIIFPGGADINPRIYGEGVTFSNEIDINRDEIESNILRRLVGNGNKYPDLKIFAVCRGHQLVNAKFGGRLYQDLGLCLHKPHPRNHPVEIVNMPRNMVLKRFIEGFKGKEIYVNSYHHQGLYEGTSNFRDILMYNNVVEANEYDDFLLTVQWHPEFDAGDFELFDNIKLWAKIKE